MEAAADVVAAAEAVRRAAPGAAPKVGVVLGSGLGFLSTEVERAVRIRYDEIPGFPKPTVEGHIGVLVLGRLAGTEVAAMAGRFHYYEGHDLAAVTFPIRVLRALGCETLVVTNAAGSINTAFEVGDLMLLSDHINNLGGSPLRGPVVGKGEPRFPDLTVAYDADLRRLAVEAAAAEKIRLRQGVYVASPGPQYETPAEIRMLRAWGADAAGMSTVPEVIVARSIGMRCLGISCLTNMAAGILPQPLSHEEVLETTERVKETFARLVRAILSRLG